MKRLLPPVVPFFSLWNCASSMMIEESVRPDILFIHAGDHSYRAVGAYMEAGRPDGSTGGGDSAVPY